MQQMLAWACSQAAITLRSCSPEHCSRDRLRACPCTPPGLLGTADPLPDTLRDPGGPASGSCCIAEAVFE